MKTGLIDFKKFRFLISFTRTGNHFPEHASVEANSMKEAYTDAKRIFNKGQSFVYYIIDEEQKFNYKTKCYEN